MVESLVKLFWKEQYETTNVLSSREKNWFTEAVSMKAVFGMKMTFKGHENFLLLSTPVVAQISKGTRNGTL